MSWWTRPTRPDDEERVRIVVPRVTSVEAIVVRAVQGAAELALTDTSDVPLRFLHRRRATIVPLTGDDRVDGRLLAVPGPQGRVRDDLLHFLQAVVPLAPPRSDPQRRDAARIDLVRPVAGADALGPGDRLRLRFELDSEDDLIDLLARVVRADDAWGLRGLRLERLTDRERERLVKFVFARQRRALSELRSRSA
jgi:PilZ domain